ncbi:cupin domain-containing protein [Candidatus Collierbacteria bacterium]|nr:cupin domain-containing protein [Candidatus Collierbacteria bacterium]
MKKESLEERSERILNELKNKYPKTKAYDLDGHSEHFVCEIEPVTDHPGYDRAVEVILKSQPHKHLIMTQYYTIISGTLELHDGEKVIVLNPGDKYTINPGRTHWAVSKNECWVEIYSKPGWTKQDHIPV